MNCRTDMQPSIPSGCMHVDDADPLHSVHSSMNASVLWLTLHIHFMALKAGGGFADTFTRPCCMGSDTAVRQSYLWGAGCLCIKSKTQPGMSEHQAACQVASVGMATAAGLTSKRWWQRRRWTRLAWHSTLLA